MPKPIIAPLVRFHSFVKISPGGCWLWTGYVHSLWGYAIFTLKKNHPVRAHKWIWEQFNGQAPKGMDLHHICGVKSCVNPAHLELLDRRDHIIRHPDHFIAKQIAQTHCKRGHPFDYMDGDGKRSCHICEAMTARERRSNDGGKWNAYQREYQRRRRRKEAA